MRRPYTTAQYADIAAQLRQAFGAENVSFTTDVIVGFPGETEEDFEASMDFVTGMRFLKVHVFPYSRREGTAAFDFPDQLPEHEKEARSHRMTAAVEEVRAAEVAAMHGRTASVLLETPLSNTLFTGLQYETAFTLGIPTVFAVAMQNIGGAVGNMTCINNAVAASATIGISGKEGKLIKMNALPMVGYTLVVIVVFAILIATGYNPIS